MKGRMSPLLRLLLNDPVTNEALVRALFHRESPDIQASTGATYILRFGSDAKRDG